MDNTTVPTSITIWVCPNCNNWAGSSSIGDISKQANHRSSLQNLADEDPKKWGQVTGHRDICQHCKAKGEGEFARKRVVYIPYEAMTKAIEQALQGIAQ